MISIQLFAPLSGWAMPLSDVPDPVFGEGMMGTGLAIDPISDTLHAPCAATVLTVHAAGHAITLRTDEGIELLMHIGIDTVAMQGAGFELLVADGARVAIGDPLIRFDLDVIVRTASAATTPIILTNAGWQITNLCTGRLLTVGDPLLQIIGDGTATPSTAHKGKTVTHIMSIGLPHGLHARPAARIVAQAKALGVHVTLTIGEKEATCTSPIALLGLGATHGAAVTITAEGAQAQAAIAAIAELLTREVDSDTAQRPSSPPVAPIGSIPDGALAGVTAASGLAVGTAVWLRVAGPVIPDSVADVATEQARLKHGLERVAEEMAESRRQPGSTGAVMAAHIAILEDANLLDRTRASIEEGMSAAGAYLKAVEAEAETLRKIPDRRIAERADDLIDVGLRVTHAILGTKAEASRLPDGAIVIADDLLPSQLIALDASKIAGIALSGGGPTSHVAILAAGMGVPMLVAIGERLHGVEDGAIVLIEADQAYLDPQPSQDALGQTKATLARRHAAEARALKASGGQTVMADGTPLSVFANLGSLEDAELAARMGAEGSGLLRTEFLFLDRQTTPDASEQAAHYSAIAQALGDRPLVIRLLDIGGDKPAPYLTLPVEENPALGLRGIRISLAHPHLFRTQLRAILSVPEIGRCRIMVPMVADTREILAVRSTLDSLRDEMSIPPVQLGVMIETPAAAISADLIAPHVDFLSIGTNDLTQYVLAMDRGNPAVAAGIDGLHPAVLRLIAATCEGAGRHGVPVSVCGGLAADPLAVPILIGLGVRTLSVPPARIPATKALVSILTLEDVSKHASIALDGPSAGHVRALARSFASAFAQELTA